MSLLRLSKLIKMKISLYYTTISTIAPTLLREFFNSQNNLRKEILRKTLQEQKKFCTFASDLYHLIS